MKLLENWKCRILLSLAIAAAISLFWNTLSDVAEAFFHMIGGHRSTWFFFSLIVCYSLYSFDVKRRKGLKLTSFSILPLFLFAVEWARLEEFPLVLVSSVCFFLSLLLLPWLGAFVSSSEQGGSQKEEVQELLGREVMYKRLHFKIRHMMNASACQAVAIYGRWGEGKTHLIRYLIEKLRRESKQEEWGRFISECEKEKIYRGSFSICKINVWQYNSLDDAWKGIIDEIMLTITGSEYRFSKFFVSFLHNFLPFREESRIGFLSAFMELLDNSSFRVSEKESDSELSVDKLNRKLRGKKVLLIFDDVERADIKIVRALMPLIERLKKIQNLLIICCIAPEELERLFRREKYFRDELRGYLIKIFDFSFHLPKVSLEGAYQMLNELLKKKYSQYALTAEFLDRAKLPFDSPRQLERTLDLLTSLEWTYFQGEEKDEEHSEEFAVFAIEILRMLYGNVLQEAKKEGKIDEWFKSFSFLVPRTLCGVNDNKDSIKQEDEWKKKHLAIYNMYRGDLFLEKLLSYLFQFRDGQITRAVEGDYAKRINMTKAMTRQFVPWYEKNISAPIKEKLNEYLGLHNHEEKDIEFALKDLFYYLLQDIEKESYRNLISYLLHNEMSDSKRKSSIFRGTALAYYFVQILRSYLEKENEEIVNLLRGWLFQLFNLLEFNLKIDISCLLVKEINNGGLDSWAREKVISKNDVKKGKIEDLNSYLHFLKKRKDDEKFVQIMKRICMICVRVFLEDMNNSGTAWRKYQSLMSELLEKSKMCFCHEAFQEGAEEFMSGSKTLNTDFLKNLLEFLMAEEKEEDEKVIMYVRPSNLDVFGEMVNTLSQNEEQMRSLSQDFLEEKKSVCEFSVSRWWRDTKRLSAAAELGSVGVGAKQMLELLEYLLQKKGELSKKKSRPRVGKSAGLAR